MKTTDTSYRTIESKNTINGKNISNELAELFGIDTTKNNINSILNTDFLDTNVKEVNLMEEQLAELFGKEKEMNTLSSPIFTISSVMKSYDEYESRITA